MAVRIVQVCGLWFWVAFALFVFVVIHQSQSILPVTATGSLRHGPSDSKLPEPIRSKGLSTLQRMARSEAAWQSSVILRHEMAAKHPDNPNVPFFPAQELHLFGQFPYTLWDFFPATYTCPHDIQRVGRLGDGGKWVCGMSLYEARLEPSASRPSDETIIYSFGVNDESTFEAEMLARVPSAVIYAFDFSVTSFGPQLAPAHQERAHFKQVGLGSKDEVNRTPQFFTLSTLMAQNKHTYMDILKIDVEGSEYQAFDAFMDWVDANGGVMPIGQVMIELHLMDDKNVNFERFTAWWERLEGFGMRPTWLEVNLMAVTLGKGKTDPRCVEYVWVNSKDPRSILLAE
ncbi:methyltransferase domain-containing protein [Amylocarpus encephaloides]|uniref:Methyltransferase domain-containing protein n=1 Tax=Amylocarpus encephaloides TaxID=45428 RepID=A0A9P7YBY3_9HELO|nr:methyltransferase domain-containing protein [Amylocarpus encephaloides]